MMQNNINNYEQQFIRYYKNKYDIEYIKVQHNNGLVPTKITLYNRNKRVVRHQPTFFGVTVKNMFRWLEENRIYEVDELLTERK